MQKRKLALVSEQCNGINEIRGNIKYFNRGAKATSDNCKRARKLLTGSTYWVYDEETRAFGPSKFVGFRLMTFECYNSWVEKPKARRGRFSGKATREANEKVIGKKFNRNVGLSKKLLVWGHKLFGRDIFKGVCQCKWRFLEIPKKRLY